MNENTLVDQLIPYWPGIVTIFGALIVGGFAMWNRKRGNVENRAPSTSESWREADTARKRLRIVEDAYWLFRHTFQGYYYRVRSGGSTDLTTKEQLVIDARPLDWES